MAPNIEYRIGKPEDLDDIVALWKTFDQEPLKKIGFNFDILDLRELFKLYVEKYVSYGIWIDETFAGGILGYTAPLVFNPSITMFHEVLWFIDPKHRRYSICFIKEFERFISQYVDKIEMCNWSTIEELTARKMYERLGYKLLEQRFVKETI